MLRGVAQFGSARALGAWGRGFESLHPDQFFFREEEEALAGIKKSNPKAQANSFDNELLHNKNRNMAPWSSGQDIALSRR